MSIFRSFFNFLGQLPQRLSRVTSGGKFIKEIDGLRFIAILPVVVYHLTERFERYAPMGMPGAKFNDPTHIFFDMGPLGPFRFSNERVIPAASVVNMGFLGVYIFFVISGFILAIPFAAHKLKGSRPVKIGSYYWRRVTRLEPTYIIWCTLLYILFVFVKHTTFAAYVWEYFSTITYTHTLIYQIWSPFNPVTWTLEVEIQFYILAPFLAAFFFAIKKKVLRRSLNAILIFVLMVLQSRFGWVFWPYKWCILAFLQYFLIGFMLADIYLIEWSDGIKRAYIYDIVAILALILFYYSWSWAFEFANRFFLIIALFVFFFAAFKSVWVNRFICNRWITAIGGMCYTIYLIHLPVAEFFIKVTKNLHVTDGYAVNLLVQLVLFLPLVFICSAIGFLLFEKPFMEKDWPQKLVATFRKKEPQKTN